MSDGDNDLVVGTAAIGALLLGSTADSVGGSLWLAPLQLRNQKRLLFSNEVLAAWSSIEVLVLCLFAALIQISRLATFILGGRGDSGRAYSGEKSLP